MSKSTATIPSLLPIFVKHFFSDTKAVKPRLNKKKRRRLKVQHNAPRAA